MMQKTVCAVIAAVLWCSFAAAQEPREWKAPSDLPYGNEIGLRYGVQVGLGGPNQPDMQYIALDYARYNYSNIGFRTGLNWYVKSFGIGQYASVPMQFTWRSGKLKSKNQNPDPHGYYYNGQFYPDKDFGNPASILADALLPRLPSIIELHAGVTPGVLFGAMGVDTEGFSIDRRFTCTADIGGRLNLPIKRVRIFLDITYHYYLTQNFRDAALQDYVRRSFFGIGGGVACNF